MLGERLKQLREAKGLTQQELARLVNLSQQTIGHYEVDRAEPSTKTLELLADIFETTIDYLLGRSDQPRPAAWQIAEAPTGYHGRPDYDALTDLPAEARRTIADFIEFIYAKYRQK